MDIRKFREKHRLSLEDLASAVGVSFMTIYRWETGKTKHRHKVLDEKLQDVMKAMEVAWGNETNSE